jgi:hypothetical protein
MEAREGEIRGKGAVEGEIMGARGLSFNKFTREREAAFFKALGSA